MMARPLSSASCFISSTLTGMPALAKFIAMPPPMVPAPMTAADRISRVGVSAGTSGILAAARSPKKMWRSARDSGDSISSMNSCHSRLSPWSKGSSVEAATASRQFSGAGSRGEAALTAARATAR